MWHLKKMNWYLANWQVVQVAIQNDFFTHCVTRFWQKCAKSQQSYQRFLDVFSRSAAAIYLAAKSQRLWLQQQRASCKTWRAVFRNSLFLPLLTFAYFHISSISGNACFCLSVNQMSSWETLKTFLNSLVRNMDFWHVKRATKSMLLFIEHHFLLPVFLFPGP